VRTARCAFRVSETGAAADPADGVGSADPLDGAEAGHVARVTSVEYHYHQRDDKTPSLRVEYLLQATRIAQEWICLEHTGFARDKAETWW
jgi:hypothetical protein